MAKISIKRCYLLIINFNEIKGSDWLKINNCQKHSEKHDKNNFF